MSFDPKTAVPVDTGDDDQTFDPKTAKPVDDSVGRQLALGGRAMAQGVVGTLTAPANMVLAGPAYLASKIAGKEIDPMSLFPNLMTKAGAPVPETSGENLTSAGISGLTGGLAGGGLYGITGIPNAIRSGAAGASSGLSQESAKQMELPKWAQVAAGLVGGMVPSALESTVQTIGGLFAPLTSGGQSRAVGALLNNQARNPSEAQMNLWESQPTVPGAMPTSGTASQDIGLLGVEKAMRGSSSSDFGERLSVANAARQAELNDIGGTPKDLQAAIEARRDAVAPLYTEAASQSAPIDNEMIALMQRPSMQVAIANAKKLAEDKGQSFGLSSTAPGAPMSLSGADLQGIKMSLDDMRSTGFSQGIGAHQQRALQDTTDALKDWMQRNVPAQRAADAAFENMSAPINKMTTVQALKNQASTNTPDTLTGQYLLSPAAYDNALDKVLAEPQNGLGKADITRLEALRKDLHGSVASGLFKAPGSDTFQNLSLNQNFGAFAKPLGGLLSPAYKLGGSDAAVNALLTKAMLNPQLAASLMQKAAAAKMIPASSWNPYATISDRAYESGILGGLLGGQQ